MILILRIGSWNWKSGATQMIWCHGILTPTQESPKVTLLFFLFYFLMLLIFASSYYEIKASDIENPTCTNMTYTSKKIYIFEYDC